MAGSGLVHSPPKCLAKVKNETHDKHAAAQKVGAPAVVAQEDPARDEGDQRRPPRPPKQPAKGQQRRGVDDNVGYGGCSGLFFEVEK